MFAIARDLWLTVLAHLTVAFWQLRVWGITEEDICATSILAISACTSCIATMHYSGERSTSYFAVSLFSLLPKHQFIVDCKDRYGKVLLMKLVVQSAVVVWGLLLLYQTPSLYSQENLGTPPTIYQIAKEHEDRLDKFERIQLQQGEQIKGLLTYQEQQSWWFVSIGMCVVVTIIGMTLSDAHKTWAAGKRELQRESNRVTARKLREAREDAEDCKLSDE